jgi:ketosteroid isomerase-like protein
VEPFTEDEIRRLANDWYRKLDVHAPVEGVLALLAEDGFEIRIPEGTFRGRDGFRHVYEEGWLQHFFDEVHELKQLSFTSTGDKAKVAVVVNWQARTWDPPEPKSKLINMDAYQTWVVQRSPNSGQPVILTYTVDTMKPMRALRDEIPTRRVSMDTGDVVTRYYELANKGDWDRWTDLFADDQVMDEQLAGHVEGRDALRQMMKGFPTTYPSFQNVPRHIVIEGEQAAVVSHISATTPRGGSIEVDVANYFRIIDGRITYMANFHDTAPYEKS